MPFTLAHPAAVVLLRRTRLPVAAMVAGSMAPDVPMFIQMRGLYDFTHSFVGVFTLDLVMSIAAIAFWFALLRDPLVDFCPAPIRERVSASVRYSAGEWRLVVPAALLGSLTHVLWDAFTHEDRWGVRLIGWLQERHGGHTGASWAQYVSSVVGMVVVAFWVGLVMKRLPREPRPPTIPILGVRALGVIAVITVGSGVAAALTTGPPGIAAEVAQAAVVGTIMLVFSALAAAGLWQVLTNRD